MPGQHSQPIPTLDGSRVYAYLGVTCHLHFWQNDCGLLRATAVTKGWGGGWNGHWIRVSTKLWKRKFPCHSSGEGHELATFRSQVQRYTNKLSWLPVWFFGVVFNRAPLYLNYEKYPCLETEAEPQQTIPDCSRTIQVVAELQQTIPDCSRTTQSHVTGINTNYSCLEIVAGLEYFFTWLWKLTNKQSNNNRRTLNSAQEVDIKTG